MGDLRPEDAERLFRAMHPDRVLPRARAYGAGDPVMGALAAYRDLRAEVRSIAREIARRDGHPLGHTGFALAMRAMGYVGRFQPVAPLEPLTDWRRAAPAVLGDEIAIPGGVWVPVPPRTRPHALNLAAFRAMGRALVLFPELNRARLHGRIYERCSPEVMIHTAPELDVVRTVVIDPTRSTGNAWRRALRGMRRVERHWLQGLATDLLVAWCREGFIGSPAGAMMSPVGDTGIEFGWAPLVPGNGIPLALTICKPIDGRAFIGCRPDHRVVDAPHLGKLYRHLKEEIPRWLRSSTASSASPSSARAASSTTPTTPAD